LPDQGVNITGICSIIAFAVMGLTVLITLIVITSLLIISLLFVDVIQGYPKELGFKY
jgi:hypothetical protein